MRFMPHAKRRSSAPSRLCCLQLGWACWDRCSTGQRPLRWHGAAWRPCPRTEIDLTHNEQDCGNSPAVLLVAASLPDLCAGLLLLFSLLGLVVMELLGAVDHLVAGICRVVPALDFHTLAFKILVDGKEV